MAWKIIKREILGGCSVAFCGPGTRGEHKSLLSVDIVDREALETFGQVRLELDSVELITLWGGIARMYAEREDIDADSELVIETCQKALREVLSQTYYRRRGKPIPGVPGAYYCLNCGVLPMVPLRGEECCEACGAGMENELMRSILGSRSPQAGARDFYRHVETEDGEAPLSPALVEATDRYRSRSRDESVVVHHLHHGVSACEFSRLHGLPGGWPPGHKWDADWNVVTCQACIDERERKADGANGRDEVGV